MTYWAEATARASEGVASYSCGSVLGLEMMLCTVTLSPPSCAARLPHKFSAATTGSFPPSDRVEVDRPPQAARTSAATPSAPITAAIGRDPNNVFGPRSVLILF